MTPLDLILAALALWIVTHTVSTEIPFTAKMGKPVSCQLCLSGWAMIVAIISTIAVALAPDYDFDAHYILEAGAIWAGSVLIEAAYHKLQTIII